MTEDEISAAVSQLAELRRHGGLTPALNATPATVAEAHAIQDRTAVELGENIGAFKANAPPGAPVVRGLIFGSATYSGPARVAATAFTHKGVEGEIAFRFRHDLPARNTDYSRAEVVQAITALPAIEIVSGRFTDPQSRPALEQLADCLMNGALVLGTELTNWRPLDIANLRVKAWINGEQFWQQVGGHPIGDPVGVAVALVNLMREQDGIKAGQVVTTGSCTGIRYLQPGDRFEVEFEGLGATEVVFVA
jgi:2-keto-4-pentenoate hydratase